MVEGILQFLIQPLPVLPEISVHQFDHLLNGIWIVLQIGCEDVFSPRVSPSAESDTFMYFYALGNIGSFEDWVAHVFEEWHLLLVIYDGERQQRDELAWITHMDGRGVDGRFSLGE